MRHYKKGRKLGTDASHTAAIKKNLMVNLFLNDRIKTTLERAKEVRGDVDRIITWAKRGDIHSRRLAIAKLGDKQLVAEIFAKVEQGLFKDRPGGYTRIYKVGKRRGDDAIIVLLELVQEPVQFKKQQALADEKDQKGGLRVEKKGGKKAKGEAAKAETVETDEAAVQSEEADDATETTEVDVVAEPTETTEADVAAEDTEATEPTEATEAKKDEEAPAEEVAKEAAEKAPAEEPATEDAPPKDEPSK